MAGHLGPPLVSFATLASPVAITNMITFVPLPYPVIYDVDITVYVDGTVTSADEDNFILSNGGGGFSLKLPYPILPGNTGLPYVAKYRVEGFSATSVVASSLANPRMIISTGGAGTTGSLYHAM